MEQKSKRKLYIFPKDEDMAAQKVYAPHISVQGKS